MRTHALLTLGLVALIGGAGCNRVEVEGGEPLDLEPWGARFQGDAESDLFPTAIASGPEGDVLLGGNFRGNADLGGGVLVADALDAVFVAHLDAAGDHLFSGSTGSNDNVSGVAVGPEGDLYVAGNYDGAINFGSGKLIGYKNGYLAAFQSGGASAFSLPLGGEAEDWVDDVAVTPSGDVVVAARAANDTDFGGGAPVVKPYSSKDAVIVAYDRQGQYRWDVRIPGAVHRGLSLASDASGNIVVTGRSYDDIQVSGSEAAGAALQSGPGSFIAKIGAGGTPLWLQTSVSSQGVYPEFYEAAVGPDGSIFVSGSHYGVFSIAGLGSGDAYDSETFWLRLSPEGDGLHFHDLKAPNYYGVPQLAVAPSGELLVGMTTFYTLDLGGGLLSTGPGQNAILARFTPDGGHLESIEIEGANEEQLHDLAVDPNGNAVIVGWFDAQVTIGGEQLTAETGSAMFVGRMDF